MKDTLGDKMKEYELQSSYKLPQNTYFIVRLDGKKFSNWTKKLDKPFDTGFAEDMVATAKHLCSVLQGAVFAYYQSDEISILFTDFEKDEKQRLYDGKIQKITSISASMATAYFNKLRMKRELLASSEGPDMFFEALDTFVPAMFDSRAFSISDPNDVLKNFWWRQKDATKNSISMACYAYKLKVDGKHSGERQEILFQEKGINWNDYPVIFKRGVVIKKEAYEKSGTTRSRWAVSEPPIFNQDWSYLAELVPIYNSYAYKEQE